MTGPGSGAALARPAPSEHGSSLGSPSKAPREQGSTAREAFPRAEDPGSLSPKRSLASRFSQTLDASVC